MAAALAMSVVVYIICGWFGTYSYAIYFPALAALVQAFDFCVKEQVRLAAIPARRAPVNIPAAPLDLSPVPAQIAASRVPKHVRTRRFSENRM